MKKIPLKTVSTDKMPKKILLRNLLKSSKLFANKTAKNGATVTRFEKLLFFKRENTARCVKIKRKSHAPAFSCLRFLKACGEFLSHAPQPWRRLRFFACIAQCP